MKRGRPERSRGYRPRVFDKREPGPRILIVCEGEKTEPNYFRAFRVFSAEIVGEGYNTLSLVERAKELRDADGPYDQVWCVFDRDAFAPEDFNAAIDAALRAGMHVAYSNEAFELWYCLHFAYITSGLTRDAYRLKLTSLLGLAYRKNDSSIYGRIMHLQADATRNARLLLQQYKDESPSDRNPSTTVHLLVDELNRWAH